MKKTGRQVISLCRQTLVTLFVVGAGTPWGLANDVKVSVTGTVDSSRAAVGEPFEFRVQVRAEAATMSGIGNPRLPDLDGFRLEGTHKAIQTQIQIINGQLTPLMTQDFVYVLVPERQGSIVIGAAEVQVDEKSYSTQPIRIQVGPAGSLPKSRAQRGRPRQVDPFSDPDDLLEQMLRRHGLGGMEDDDDGAPALNEKEAFFIRLIVDKEQAYVGEQITASWYLYTRNEVRNIDSLKYPDLKGFWKEDIDRATGLVFEEDVVNGVRFRRAPLMSFALFPLKEGVAVIDPYKVKCTIVQGSAFGFGRPFTFTKISPEKKIQVLARPTAGLPKDYSGAVGDFDIKSSVASTKIVVGQPFSVKVRIEGRGNAKMIDLPPWELPKSLEQFEVKADSKFFRTGESYKEFEVLLVPRVAGPAVLPELSFSTFDTKTRSYVRKLAPAIPITVLPGGPSDSHQSQRLAETKQKEATGDVLPEPAVSFEEPLYHRRSAWVLLIVALSLGIIGFSAYQIRGLAGKPGAQRWEKFADAKLKRLNALCEQQEFRKYSAEALNFVSQMLGALANDKGAYREWREWITQFPVSFREKLEPELRPVMDDLEGLAFAPEGALGGRTDEASLKRSFDGVKRVSKMILDQMKQTSES